MSKIKIDLFFVFIFVCIVVVIGLMLFIVSHIDEDKQQKDFAPISEKQVVGFRIDDKIGLKQDLETGYYYGVGYVKSREGNLLNIDFVNDGERIVSVDFSLIQVFSVSGNDYIRLEDRLYYYERLNEGDKVAVTTSPEMTVSYINIMSLSREVQ